MRRPRLGSSRPLERPLGPPFPPPLWVPLPYQELLTAALIRPARVHPDQREAHRERPGCLRRQPALHGRTATPAPSLFAPLSVPRRSCHYGQAALGVVWASRPSVRPSPTHARPAPRH